ncbi:MAG: S26 family signal peptidase [Planctomycetia bacterium]|nr:S26 family signal peptidase [Planctomycetia bacterium]
MSATATAEETRDVREDKKKHPRDPAREVVETIVFVVVLVLLLKLFVTEAFVIPTGSMAETLYGYQKIIKCPKCGHEFPVNTHDEIEPNPTTKRHHKLVSYCCPNCRYLGQVDELNPAPKYRTGDRVLVLKPLYHISRPQPGDVVVFKYPEAPQEKHTAANYIKRVWGFGGETIAILNGQFYRATSLAYLDSERPANSLDLWKPEYMYINNKAATDLFAASRLARFPAGQGGFEIIRKTEEQILATRRIVWDNDKQAKELLDKLGPAFKPRWGSEVNGRWSADDGRQPRAFLHQSGELDWIRYSHLTWKLDPKAEVNQRKFVPWRWNQPVEPPIAGPIDNMLGYNAGIDCINPREDRKDWIFQSREQGQETLWVGDLILECEAQLGPGTEVILELSRGVNRFQAKFANGQVTLSRTGPLGPEFGTPSRPCKVNAGTYKLRFANVDARLMVWVDEKRIDFGSEGDYTPVENTNFEPDDFHQEGWTRANDIDAPASIGAKGQVTIRGIKLFRDIYYTRLKDPPSAVDTYYVQPGHYLCLGDNSAQSADSRKWGTVPERLMLGKAVFVFWPGFPAPNRIGFIK